MSLYERVVRPALFALEPERAHALTVEALALAGRLPGTRAALGAWYGFEHRALETGLAGLRFKNPVGLAAGFDKDCRLAGVLPSLGFGFLELGTVTPRPQPGNHRPRVFRVPESEALVNRLGFNSRGAAYAAERLKVLQARPVPVGINLGMNADTPADRAPEDFAEAFQALEPCGDFFVVNVSSPNTPGLRELQERIRLERILTALRGLNRSRKPVFVKLSPDLDDQVLAGLAALLLEEASGAVVSNTTTSRPGLPESWAGVPGGLSGAPLRDRSTELIARLRRMTEGRLPIIGVGGILGARDAYEKIRAGASLVEVYTGLVYRGPGLVREINEGLVGLLEKDGFKSVAEAVGVDAPAGTAA